MADKILQTPNIMDYKIYDIILSGSLKKMDLLCDDPYVKVAIFIALSKTLDKIKDGKISPAVFPFLIEKDLQLDQEELAIELSIICAYFHTAADLADDIEDNSTDNPVINKYGKSQAINISNKLIFIYQELISQLNIEPKNKIELMSFFAKCGNVMTNGQFHDLSLTNKIYFPHEEKNITINEIISITRRKSGIEIGCFVSCLLIAFGKPADLYNDLGILYGSLTQIFSDYFDIWGKQKSDDLLSFKNSLPIFSAHNDNDLNEKVRMVFSGLNDSPDKQFDLRRFLSKTKSIENFKTYFEICSNEINNLLEMLPPLEIFSAMIDDLFDNCKFFIDILSELREVTELDKISDSFELESSKTMALDYINSDRTLKDTWEIQRWGFLNEPILIGNIFSPALVLETLLDKNEDISSNIQDLMNLKGYKGWYYYSNTTKIPTDADVLGQLLNLVGRTGQISEYKHLFKEPLQILERNIESSGRCPTWLDDGINHHKFTIDNTWYGNDCLGVMANLYYGLFLFDKETYMPLILKGIGYIINNLPSDKLSYSDSSYYTYYYMFYVVSRLANALNLKFDELENMKNKLVREQLLNGSWNNSSQDTAFVLLGLMTFSETDSLLIKTASKYLIESQNFDGSWNGEDLFLCPGKNGRIVYYKNAKVTSAFCLRALIYASHKINKKIVISKELIKCQS